MYVSGGWDPHGVIFKMRFCIPIKTKSGFTYAYIYIKCFFLFYRIMINNDVIEQREYPRSYTITWMNYLNYSCDSDSSRGGGPRGHDYTKTKIIVIDIRYVEKQYLKFEYCKISSSHYNISYHKIHTYSVEITIWYRFWWNHVLSPLLQE